MKTNTENALRFLTVMGSVDEDMLNEAEADAGLDAFIDHTAPAKPKRVMSAAAVAACIAAFAVVVYLSVLILAGNGSRLAAWFGRNTEAPTEAETLPEDDPDAVTMQRLRERMSGPFGDSEIEVLNRSSVSGAEGALGFATQAGTLGDFGNALNGICFNPITSTAFMLCRDPLCVHPLQDYESTCPFLKAQNFYWLSDTVLVYTSERWYATDETMMVKGKQARRYDVTRTMYSYNFITEEIRTYRVSDSYEAWVSLSDGNVVQGFISEPGWTYYDGIGYRVGYLPGSDLSGGSETYTAVIDTVDLTSGETGRLAGIGTVSDKNLRVLYVNGGTVYLMDSSRKTLYRFDTESGSLTPVCENLRLKTSDGAYIRDGMLYLTGYDVNQPANEYGGYEDCLYRIDLAAEQAELLFHSPLAFAVTNDYLFIIQFPEDGNWEAGMPLVRYTPDGKAPVTVSMIPGDGYVSMSPLYGEMYIHTDALTLIRCDLSTGALYWMSGEPIEDDGSVPITSFQAKFIDETNRTGVEQTPADGTAPDGYVPAGCVPQSNRSDLIGQTFRFDLTDGESSETFYWYLYRNKADSCRFAVLVEADSIPLLLVFEPDAASAADIFTIPDGKLNGTLLAAVNVSGYWQEQMRSAWAELEASGIADVYAPEDLPDPENARLVCRMKQNFWINICAPAYDPADPAAIYEAFDRLLAEYVPGA